MRASLVFVLLFLARASLAVDGLITKASEHPVSETIDRLQSLVEDKGFTVFARIDHAAGAAKIGESLPASQVLVFGNPKVGTALMSSRITASLDLPVRVAVWEDSDGRVWIGYDDPHWLAARHGITDRAEVVAKMAAALARFTDQAGR